jgi:hypothetical protein
MTEPDDTTIDQPDGADVHEQETIPPSASAAELAAILDRYLADLQAGEAPDRAQLLAAHPDLAAQLEGCLAGIEFVYRATGPAATEPASLGEFQIVREIGRGGMGVVYEAEQTSLRRHVALKVLRFGVVADEEAMQRFRREAETVARLHHTNIVPIFAFGCERGVHYYAMQFIEGRSLADVLDESQSYGTPLKADDVARWGLQAAEALAHAHQRGVIHRDIKPSNLLIDAHGVVWLTDFGLARRADEVTLTASGALMGTPRYMSPEQAEAVQRSIDHRTDIYSLGASLYELATGWPAFDSATPHGVVIQILTEEPARPRQLRPDLPRDLETIVLTCLAKDPAQRYQTAQALADDLRAVLEARPIQARRVPLVERVARYVRKRKATLGRGAVLVAATAALIVGSFLGWRAYAEWRSGEVVLATDGPPLRAEILAETGDEPIGEPFDVGTRTPRRLPAGEYRLRVTGNGLLGQTYRFGVDRGESRPYAISLDEGRLLGPDPIPYGIARDALVLSPGRADFVEWTGEALVRRDAATGRPIWDASRPTKPRDPKHDPIAWIRRLAYHGDEQRPGVLTDPAPDLDGDGTADIVWAFRGTPSLLAHSGKDGAVLWTYTADADGPGGPDPHGPAWPDSTEHVPRFGRILGAPSHGDIDGDGVPDLVAAFAVFDDRWSGVRPPGPAAHLDPWQSAHAGRRAIVAVSGRSGRELWREPIDRKTTTIAPDHFDSGATLLHDPRGSTIAFVDGSRWIGLNPATGRPRGQPIDLRFVPARPVQYADLDGDGAMDVLAVNAPYASSPVRELAAFSPAAGMRMWLEPIGIPFTDRNAPPMMGWPLVVDLDGDGRAEVVIPDRGSLAPHGADQGVRLIDGATGRTRWLVPSSPDTKREDGLAHLIAGPDLDGDGTRDLVAVSRYNGRNPMSGSPAEPARIYVDALSGRDGHSLWRWYTDVAPGSDFRSPLVWPPRWWGRGGDGWPMLAVPLGGKLRDSPDGSKPGRSDEPASVHVLSASDGSEPHTITGLSWPAAADLDGDGLEDLWGSVDGKLRAIRAEMPQAWRALALGRFDGASDFDGDGIHDALSQESDRGTDSVASRPTFVARSGRDGRVLWRSASDQRPGYLDFGNIGTYRFSTAPLPVGDLDGDGAPDVVASKHISEFLLGNAPKVTLPLLLLSGRSGRPVWSAGPLPLGFDAKGYTDLERIDLRACAPRERADVLVFHASRFALPGSVSPGTVYRQNRLARVSGRDGRVVWDVPLVERKGTTMSGFTNLPREYGDLDGDGGLDIVMMVQVDGTSFERRALSLRDGKMLWSHPAPFHPNPFPAFAVGDMDGDGCAEVVVRDAVDGDARGDIALTVLDGRDGSARWTWRGGWNSPRDPGDSPGDFCLADLEGRGRRDVCLNVAISRDKSRIAILDARGHERAGRDRPASWSNHLMSADLDGDGRDELLFLDADRLHAARGDLVDLWSWPTRQGIRQIIPAQGEQPSVVVLESMIGLDGATGRPGWAGQGGRDVLDPGGPTQPPRLLSSHGDATICRMALPTGVDGSFQPGRGAPVEAAYAVVDPRWARPLPWNRSSGGSYVQGTFVLGGLAFINIVIPLAILHLATRRRFWSVRLLLALPVAVAIPMAAFLTIIKLSPAPSVSVGGEVLALVAYTVLGIPVLEYLGGAVLSVVHRRWRRLAILAISIALVSLVIGAFMLWADAQTKASIEHYDWRGWYLAVVPGAYILGLLLVIGRIIGAAARLTVRAWKRAFAR